MSDEDISRAKQISIVDYLVSGGRTFEKRGGRTYFQSPFSYDRTPSLCVYPANTFYDWANGFGGDIIKLVMEIENVGFHEAVSILLNGDVPLFDKSFVEIVSDKEIDIEKFTKVTNAERKLIDQYALSRGIIRNYEPSCFIIKDNEEFIRRPSVGYIHVDENMNPCGIKMRDISPYKERRFSARGSQKFYVLRNTEDSGARMYIVESESSANSLFEYLCIIKQPCVVISFGSWNNVPKKLPESLSLMDKRSVIIDYDGDEELYQERISRFDHLDAREIKLELPKGEDINSLFKSGAIHKYKKLFNNVKKSSI